MESENNLKTLTKQTRSVRCVINFPCKGKLYNLSAYNLNQFAEDLTASSFLYAFIVHDKDVDENGEFKTVHIHLWLTCSKRHQLKYYVYLIADLLQCNESLISVRVSNSDSGDIQYLVHKNNPDKFHYDVKDIKTNLNKDMFEDLMNRKIIESFTIDELYKICLDNSKLDVMKILGPERYVHYSKVIADIYKIIAEEKREKDIKQYGYNKHLYKSKYI